MLVATRDPVHQSGAPDPSSHRDHLIHMPPPRTARVMSMLQLAGSFLAIPVALGSAYTVYQTNFSPDTQCQQLRAGIIAMIDKKIDAATRRMLVRRDVETFEKSCGAFDPDAKAAFVTLLQAEPRAVPVRPAASPAPKVEAVKSEPAKAEAPKAESAKVEATKTEAAKPAPVKVEAAKVETKPEIKPEMKAETPAKEAVRKVEPRPAAVARQAAPVAPAAAETEQVDPAVNDARWLEAVRGALVSHDSARETAVSMRPRAPAEESPALRSSVAPAAPAAAAPPVAPALPPATAVGEAPAPPPARSAHGDDHPVPPGSIPTPPLDIAKEVNGGSSWVSDIPFVGQILDK